MYGYKNVKWVAEINLVPRARHRLLGAIRLRQRRLGRPLERIRDMKPGYVRRFSRVERLLHWVNALGFFFLLATGLILYLPSISILVGAAAADPEPAFLGRASAGSPRSRSSSCSASVDCDAPRGSSSRSTATTLRWLRGGKAPQGRFNAGQKINAALTAAFTILFGVSGSAALVRRAEHALPLREHGHPPRRPDVRLARAARRASLSRADSSGDATRAARDDARHRERGMGSPAPQQVGAGATIGRCRPC